MWDFTPREPSQLQTVAEKSRDGTALQALKENMAGVQHLNAPHNHQHRSVGLFFVYKTRLMKKTNLKLPLQFFVLLMYRCATDFLARRCRNEECAGFLGEHMLRAALGVKTELFPEWGK